MNSKVKNEISKLEDFFWKKEYNEIVIDNIENIHLLLDLFNKNKDEWIFRGQSNKTKINSTGERITDRWKLESSLRREYKVDSVDNKFLIDAMKGVVEYINDRNPTKKDVLEILAEMQHYGNPTLLIDFSVDIFLGLYFGFKNENIYKSYDKCYVSLFVLKVEEEKIKYKIEIDDIYKVDEVLACPNSINRGISQKSLFILDNKNDIEKERNFHEIRINYKLKEDIINLISRKGIKDKYVFPDNEGLYKEYFNSNEKILFIKALALSKKLKHKEAIEKYERVIEINPKNGNAYVNWGNALSNLGKNEEACEKYEEAIEKYEREAGINPNNSNAYYNWGVTLSNLGKNEEACEKYEEAIEKYERAVGINPNDSNIYYNWGVALSNLGKNEKACEKYGRAVGINPNDSDAYINWGVALSNLGKNEKAIEKIEKAIEIDPDNQLFKDNLKITKGLLSKQKKQS